MMVRQVHDITIVGGGLAGATVAVMLGRAGHDAVLIDPDDSQRPEFRCEKLDDSQLALLEQTGIAGDVLPHTQLDREVWVIRYGRLIDRRPGGRAGIMYHDLVNTIRSNIPECVGQWRTKAREICLDDRQPAVTLADGQQIKSKLVILATGLNPRLAGQLGIDRTIISRRHTLGIGFDLEPVDRHRFDFPALTYFPDRPDQRLAYLSLFPVPGAMRANLFVYWAEDDPRLRALRDDPVTAICDYLPNLTRYTGSFRIRDRVSIRPIDLFRASQPQRPGAVMIGDAYSTSCPAAGTGANKVLTDALRLCSTYVPEWLDKSEIDAADTAAFYNDPVKAACEKASLDRAMNLRRLSTAKSVGWSCWRGARFAAQSAIGRLRELRRRLPAATARAVPMETA